ncbi:50S ribosomal protein L15 [Patescibacteria group bacterium]|nr:50S ribosomal protein L15 [Patescibacteria group bacterium]
MALTLHQLKKFPTKKKRRVGRGNGSGAGNYSGHGMKGQKSRSGGRHKGGFAGKKFPAFISQSPKRRGFKSIHPQRQTVNIGEINKHFKAGETVDPKKLVACQLIANANKDVKILGQGKLSKKLTINAHQFSKSAIDAINKAGSELVIIEGKKK